MIIPPERLSADVLRAIIEEYVTSEGTEYGEDDVPLDRKVAEVRAQIDRGEVEIVFDPKTNGVDLRPSAARGVRGERR